MNKNNLLFLFIIVLFLVICGMVYNMVVVGDEYFYPSYTTSYNKGSRYGVFPIHTTPMIKMKEKYQNNTQTQIQPQIPYNVNHLPERLINGDPVRNQYLSDTIYPTSGQTGKSSIEAYGPYGKYSSSISGAPSYPYTNINLPAPVIGCGGRRGACMGGSQTPIPNTLPPVDISNQNIAPSYIQTQQINPINLGVRGYDDGIRQVGIITRVFGKNNEVLPLYGRRIYRNDNKWEYYTKIGYYGVTAEIVPLRNWQELNTNDEIYVRGQKFKYRVTIYEDDVPQHLPYF